jgi:hypothetical protein
MPEMSEMKCAVVGCGNKAAGYFNGPANTEDLDLGRVPMPTADASWCKEHQQKVFVETVSGTGTT